MHTRTGAPVRTRSGSSGLACRGHSASELFYSWMQVFTWVVMLTLCDKRRI